MTFLFCLLLAYVVVRGCEDVTAAVRKQPPPRQEVRKAKLAARENNGGTVPRSPAGRYVTGLIDDAWDSAHHRRQLMADERARRRERRVSSRIERRKAREQRRDEKHARTNGAPERPQAVGFDVEAPTAPELTPEQQTAVTRWKRANAAGEKYGISADTWDSIPTDMRVELVADAWRNGLRPCGINQDGHEIPLSQRDPDVAQRLEVSGLTEPQNGPLTPVLAPRSSPAPPTDQPVPEPTAADTTAESDCAPAEQEDSESPSNVIPFPEPKTDNPTPQRMELPTMSSPGTGEVTGLNSAIAYAEQLSAYCTHTGDQIGSVLPSGQAAATSCEQARESLAGGGVTGEPLTNVSSVQDEMTAAVEALNQALAQLEAAGASAEALTSQLRSHLSVQEAYSANPDAGSKDFVTAD